MPISISRGSKMQRCRPLVRRPPLRHHRTFGIARSLRQPSLRAGFGEGGASEKWLTERPVLCIGAISFLTGTGKLIAEASAIVEWFE
jgi:hypothetical protein